nr:hypothetical protein [Pleurocapsa sp. MO_192.B19]
DAVGNGGKVNITTENLTLSNGGIISTSTFGQGDASDINIATANLTLDNDGLISASTRGQGDGGLIDINASESITLDDGSISNTVGTDAVGNGGKVNITTENLTLSNGGIISTSTFGQGDASDINITTANLTLDNDGLISAGTFSQGDGGLIDIIASELITLDDGSIINNVTANAIGNGGKLNITTENLTLSNDGLISASTGGEGDSGSISIDVTELVTLDNSDILNTVRADAVGNAGEINITTENLALNNGSEINASTEGEGNSGKITIDATESLSVDGIGSSILSRVETEAVGNSGDLNITTSHLDLTNGGQIAVSTFGEGNGGMIFLDATESVILNDGNIFNTVGRNAIGNSGELNITTPNLTMTNDSLISTSTFGKGNAGDVTFMVQETINLIDSNIFSNVEREAVGKGGNLYFTANSLSLEQGAQLQTIVRGTNEEQSAGIGQAGNINLDVKDTITLTGSNAEGNGSSIFSVLGTDAEGKAGNIKINTGSLVLTNDRSLIRSSTFGQGNTGDITITAEEEVNLVGGYIQNNIERGALGEGGELNITANSLSLEQGAQLQTIVRGTNEEQSAGIGHAGNINLDVKDTITLTGSNAEGIGSLITSELGTGSKGSAGNIDIKSGLLTLTDDDNFIRARTFGKGDAGSVTITANEAINIVDGNILSAVGIGGIGNGGNIYISTALLSLIEENGNASISASTFGEGNAGNVFVEVAQSVSLVDGSSIESGVRGRGVGNGGDVEIETNTLSLTNGSQVGAFVFRAEDDVPGGRGNGGNIKIIATDFIDINGINPKSGFSSGLLAISEQGAEGNAGNITVDTNIFRISNSGELSSGTRNTGNGGNIFINANTLEATEGGQVRVTSRDAGNAGSINLNITDKIVLSGSDPTFLDVLERFGENRVSEAGPASGIFSNGTETSTGNAGSLMIDTQQLIIQGEAEIDVSNRGTGNAGDLIIDSNSIELYDRGSINASTESGLGGNINLQIDNSLTLRNDSGISAQALGGADGGNITLSADSIIAFDDSDIFAFAEEGKGGNITLDTPAYFGENFTLNTLKADPKSLENNNRADVNATGAVLGSVSIPDVSFIQNSLNDLPDNSINTNELVANSCVAPVGNRQQGKFIITGGDSLPVRPGNAISISDFDTGEVRSVTEGKSSWQRGDAIVEPQGIYRLANGKLILSRECSE